MSSSSFTDALHAGKGRGGGGARSQRHAAHAHSTGSGLPESGLLRRPLVRLALGAGHAVIARPPPRRRRGAMGFLGWGGWGVDGALRTAGPAGFACLHGLGTKLSDGIQVINSVVRPGSGQRAVCQHALMPNKRSPKKATPRRLGGCVAVVPTCARALRGGHRLNSPTPCTSIRHPQPTTAIQT